MTSTNNGVKLITTGFFIASLKAFTATSLLALAIPASLDLFTYGDLAITSKIPLQLSYAYLILVALSTVSLIAAYTMRNIE